MSVVEAVLRQLPVVSHAIQGSEPCLLRCLCASSSPSFGQLRSRNRWQTTSCCSTTMICRAAAFGPPATHSHTPQQQRRGGEVGPFFVHLGICAVRACAVAMKQSGFFCEGKEDKDRGAAAAASSCVDSTPHSCSLSFTPRSPTHCLGQGAAQRHSDCSSAAAWPPTWALCLVMNE